MESSVGNPKVNSFVIIQKHSKNVVPFNPRMITFLTDITNSEINANKIHEKKKKKKERKKEITEKTRKKHKSGFGTNFSFAYITTLLRL